MRKTVGQLSQELIQKKPDTRSPIEQMRENLTDYEANIQECIQQSLKKYTHNFYVVAITKKERLLENVIRHYYLSRSSCPTPDYDQIVYKYTKRNDELDLLWVIPSKDTCQLMLQNISIVAPSEYPLLQYIIQFQDLTLAKLCKTLNNETHNSPILQK